MESEISPEIAGKLAQSLEVFYREPDNVFVPADAAAQKTAFLSGETENPSQNYDKIAAIDFAEVLAKIEEIKAEFSQISNLSPEENAAYEASAQEYFLFNQIARAAYDFKTAEDETARQTAKTDFMRANRELYGTPEKATYESILAAKLSALKDKKLSGEAAKMRDELLAEFPDLDLDSPREKYAPKPETLAKLKSATEIIYAPLLQHIPEKPAGEKYSAQEIRDIFAEILRDEFGDSAPDWQVISGDGSSINVSPKDQTITVPEKRKDVSLTELRGLMAHELGVHFLRSVMGEQNSLAAMRTGLVGYGAGEEGLGKVMEQAINGKYSASGEPYYLIAGAAEFGGKDFRGCFEMISRISILEKLSDGASEIPEEISTKSRDVAYNQTQRIFRATDELPLFKDLRYYNGSLPMWQYMDEIAEDPNFAELLTLTLYGKHDPTILAHEEILRNSKPNESWGARETSAELNEAEKLQIRAVAGKFVVDRTLINSISRE